MSWYRIEGNMPQHEKYAPLSDAAFRLAITAGAWCANRFTDGFIPKKMVSSLTRAPNGKRLDSAIGELLDSGIWELVEENAELYHLHDFLDWNMSRAQWELKRDAGKSGGEAKAANNPKKSKDAPATKKPSKRLAHARDSLEHVPEQTASTCQADALAKPKQLPSRTPSKTLASPLADSDSEIEDPDQIPQTPFALSPPDAEPEPSPAHLLKLHYAAEFERSRGTKFDIPRNQWGRAQKAFASLAETYGLEQAKSIITSALSSKFCLKVAPWDILLNAASHLGAPKYRDAAKPEVAAKPSGKPGQALHPDGYWYYPLNAEAAQ